MKLTIVILILLVLQTLGYSLTTDANTTKSCVLPWQVIAEEFNKNKPFCSNPNVAVNKGQPQATQNTSSESTTDYGLAADKPVIATSSWKLQSAKVQTADVNLAMWENQQWQEPDHISATIDPNGIRFGSKIKTEGFYKFDLRVVDDSGKIVADQAYAIICDDWKKDLLAFCRGQKEDCETHPDLQLIRSSIVTSHFDDVMEIITKMPILSATLLKDLAEAVKSRQDFDAGKIPDLVVGLNKLRFKRFDGASIEEFVVFIPDKPAGTKPSAVYLYPDNRRFAARGNYSAHSGLIDLWWLTIGNKEINWKSFTEFMKILGEKVTFDEDRIYVNGECGNGLAALSLALNYPDQWAEVSASLGNTYRHLAGNAFNLPLIFVKGGHNEEYLVGYYDFAVECFRYYGSRNFKYSLIKSTGEMRGTTLPETVRERNPLRVLYTIESLSNPKSYWAKIDGREDENFNATIDAIVWGQSIFVKIKNVDAYSLYLSQITMDYNRPVEILENGQSLGFITGPKFSKKSAKYQNAVYVKNETMSGPVWDAFADPYVVVWGSGGDSAQTGNNKRMAKSLANSGPCVADTNVPDNLMSSHNLVVIGTAETNQWLAKVADKLPVQIKDGKVLADGQSYEKADMGSILIYPNPLNPAKYIAVFTGTSEKAISNILTAYSQMKSKKPADVGIFEVAQNNQINWLRLEKFDTIWNWHSQWNQVLAEPKKTHPQWQWRQWLAEVVRIQLGTDAVVLEEPFESGEPIAQEKITVRDVCSMFKNDWIVKISLRGKNLRDLLMVPFKDISSRETTAPVIAGVTLVKTQNQAQDKTICINELDDNKEYTVAFPYRAINGKRMGLVMKEYKITGEGYMALLLRDYLAQKGAVDLDTELDGMTLNIF